MASRVLSVGYATENKRISVVPAERKSVYGILSRPPIEFRAAGSLLRERVHSVPVAISLASVIR
jgi:hypothetical protein